jgi:hypothetical protein
MMILECEQCDGTGECKPGVRCPCREEDDEARERRSRMGVVTLPDYRTEGISRATNRTDDE